MEILLRSKNVLVVLHWRYHLLVGEGYVVFSDDRNGQAGQISLWSTMVVSQPTSAFSALLSVAATIGFVSGFLTQRPSHFVVRFRVLKKQLIYDCCEMSFNYVTSQFWVVLGISILYIRYIE